MLLSLNHAESALRALHDADTDLMRRLCDFEFSSDLALMLAGEVCRKRGRHGRIELLGQHSSVSDLLAVWQVNKNFRVSRDEHGFRSYESYPIFCRRSISCGAWYAFTARFTRSLRKLANINDSYSLALTQVFSDMADNAVQYSGVSSDKPARAVAHYTADSQGFSFLVLDHGVGAKTTLARNPIWQDLGDEISALEAIVQKQATSKPQNTFGDGYRSLFRALMDREASIWLRSQDGELRLSGKIAQRNCSRQRVSKYLGYWVYVSNRKVP